MTTPHTGPGLTVNAAPAHIDPRTALPDGATGAWAEAEFDDVRARLDRLTAAERAHGRRNAERRERYRAALAEHHAAAEAAVLAGEAAPEPPTDPGPEPGAVAFTNERIRLRAEIARLWDEYGPVIAARLRDRAVAEVNEIDTAIHEHEQALRDLRKNRTTPAQRVERLRSLAGPRSRPPTPAEDAEDARESAIVRSRYGGPVMPDGTPVEQAMLAQRRRSGRRRTR